MNLDKSNSRRHSDRNKAAIRKSLETAKAARSIVIDSGDNVLAGNGVAEQAEALGIPVQIVESDGSKLIAVKRVDVAPDSPEARQIATLDNLVADTSAFDYDAERLRAALANDPVSKAIAEQAYQLRVLLGTQQPDDPNVEWKGMPEFEQEDKTAWKSIIVHFDSSENLKNFAELVQQTITGKTKFIWYPKREPGNSRGVFVSES